MSDTHDEDGFGDFRQAPEVVPMFESGKTDYGLTTSGLTNCMAVVAFRPPSREAVMWHYNTAGIFKADVDAEAFDDEGTPALVFHLDRPALLQLRRDIDERLGLGDGVRYAIALGTQWRSGVARPARKQELITALTEILAPDPFLTNGQDTATWDPFTNQLS